MLVIATSSYGEGDPPENYNLFLVSLHKAAAAGEKPLAGLQHVVLGYGASCYDTFQARHSQPRFHPTHERRVCPCRAAIRDRATPRDPAPQNVPRLSDKLLGECGSRRLAMRAELDEGSDDDPAVRLKAWEQATFKALRELPSPDAPPACEWTQPAGKLLEKSESELMLGMSVGGAGGPAKIVAALAALVVAGAAYAFYGMEATSGMAGAAS